MSDSTRLASAQELHSFNWPSISEFYSSKDVFITGATGFLGKCLIEKLLRGIPNVGKIFILVRSKKGKDVHQRTEELGKEKLYQKALSSDPSLWEKVVPIVGDISLPKLGISEEDEKLLAENVSVVFHLAATVQFNCFLRESIQYNVVGVQELIKLCRKMSKLECLVHVSTAYAFCQKKTMDEVFYPNRIHYKDILKILELFTDEMIQLITPGLLEGRPNTYTYSKSLGEQVIIEEANDLPTVIVRPSIIGAASDEPLPGWIDVFHGPGGLFVATGKGLLRVLRADIHGKADIVPLDFVNNILLAAGWVTALSKTKSTLIYHCNTGTHNPISWLELYPLVIKSYYDNPFDWIFRRPHIYLCQPPSFWPLWQLFLHYIPAYIFDFCRKIVRKKPMMVRIYSKLETAIMQLDYFTQNSWEWSNDNTDRLFSIMSEEDRRNFNFDVRSLNWSSYVARFCMGTKKFLLKDDPNNLQRARQQIKRLRNIRFTFNFILFLLATRLVYIRSRIAREVWSSLLTICMQFLKKLGILNPFNASLN